MLLTEIHIVPYDKEMADICIKSKNLYNQTLYYLRQIYFEKMDKLTWKQIVNEKIMIEHMQLFRDLSAWSAQQVLRQVQNDWNTFCKIVKSYNKDKSKFKGKLSCPGYKKSMNICIFNYVKIKNSFISFPKRTGIKSFKTNLKEFKIYRIIAMSNHFKIEVIYEKEPTNLKLNKKNFLSIDLGINNFATCVNNAGQPPFIINGKVIKCFNQWYNKRKAFLQSQLPEGQYWSKQLDELTFYRNNYINDKMHKFSKHIIDYCIENNIGTIVVGKNKGWKDKINLGKKTNQKFVEIPFAKFIDKLKYKSIMVCIDVIEHEESYTSKCDFLALEPIKKQEKYLGKRKKRGLFVSSTGKLINADVNGSGNISRKVFGDSPAKKIINSGLAFNPYKINIL